LKIGTIADLIGYRRKYDSIVRRVSETAFDSRYGGDFRAIVYMNKSTKQQHIALVKGDVSGDNPVLVRMHAMSIFTDSLGENRPGRVGVIESAMKMVSAEGRGVIVLIREPLEVVMAERQRRDGQPVPATLPGELRDYGVGAQILLDLGVRNMVLLTNTKRNIVGLEGFGLSVIGQRPLPDIKGSN